jgi:hypothetical protein
VIAEHDVGSVYRSRSQVRVMEVMGLVLLVVAVVGLVAGVRAHRALWTIPWSAISVACGAFVLLRGAKARVCALPSGVRVVNPLRTYVLAWDEIEKFRLRLYGPCVVKKRDGALVGMFAIQQTNWANIRKKTDTPEQAMIDELNASLMAHQTAGPGGRRVRQDR